MKKVEGYVPVEGGKQVGVHNIESFFRRDSKIHIETISGKSYTVAISEDEFYVAISF